VVVLEERERIPEPHVPPAPPAAPALDETVFTRQARYCTAVCVFGAGVLHLLAMVAHADHHPTLGRAFLAVGALQIVWGVFLLFEPRRVAVVAGGVVTIVAIAAWVASRTKGVSWFPGLEEVDPLEWRDVVTQFFQLLALAGAAIVLLPASAHRPAGRRVELLPVAVFSLLAIVTLGVLYAATHDYVHHEAGTEHAR
jgi:hypothetical protein